MGKILSGIALFSALTFGYKADAQSLKTETSLINSDSQKGIPLQRTELTLGPVRMKYDALKNFSPKDNQQNVGGIFLDKLVDTETQKAGFGIMNLGNFDGKDETFWDAWTRVKYHGTTFGLEGGSSVRKTSSPRKFLIGTIEKLALTDNINTTLEYGFFTKNPLQNETRHRDYGWISLNNDNLFISAGNEVRNKHVFAGITGLDNFGYLAWLKIMPDGSWSLKNRIAAGTVDKNFYSNDNMISVTRTFVVPSFFGVHLNPSQSRGHYTIGLDINGDNVSTTVKAIPGIATPIGAVGAGIETKFQNNTSTTGFVGSYYNTFSVAGINGSIEANYNQRTKEASGYVKLSKEF